MDADQFRTTVAIMFDLPQPVITRSSALGQHLVCSSENAAIEALVLDARGHVLFDDALKNRGNEYTVMHDQFLAALAETVRGAGLRVVVEDENTFRRFQPDVDRLDDDVVADSIRLDMLIHLPARKTPGSSITTATAVELKRLNAVNGSAYRVGGNGKDRAFATIPKEKTTLALRMRQAQAIDAARGHPTPGEKNCEQTMRGMPMRAVVVGAHLEFSPTLRALIEQLSEVGIANSRLSRHIGYRDSLTPKMLKGVVVQMLHTKLFAAAARSRADSLLRRFAAFAAPLHHQNPGQQEQEEEVQLEQQQQLAAAQQALQRPQRE